MKRSLAIVFVLLTSIFVLNPALAAVLRTAEGQLRISVNGLSGQRGFDGANNYNKHFTHNNNI